MTYLFKILTEVLMLFFYYFQLLLAGISGVITIASETPSSLFKQTINLDPSLCCSSIHRLQAYTVKHGLSDPLIKFQRQYFSHTDITILMQKVGERA